MKQELRNPIVDNRLVVDYTFATRLLRIAESIPLLDACSEEDRDAFVNYANKLLKYQCNTVTDQHEKDYLIRVGVYERFTKPDLITYDGAEIFYDFCTNLSLYSCMRAPQTGEQVLTTTNVNKERMSNRNPDRLFFFNKAECLLYIEENSKTISLAQLKQLGLFDLYETKSK